MLWRIVFEHDGGEYAETGWGDTSQLAIADVCSRYGLEDIQILSVRECADGDWEEVDDGPEYFLDDELYDIVGGA